MFGSCALFLAQSGAISQCARQPRTPAQLILPVERAIREGSLASRAPQPGCPSTCPSGRETGRDACLAITQWHTQTLHRHETEGGAVRTGDRRQGITYCRVREGKSGMSPPVNLSDGGCPSTCGRARSVGKRNATSRPNSTPVLPFRTRRGPRRGPTTHTYIHT